MTYHGYNVTLHSIKVPAVRHLHEMLERVEQIDKKHLLPDPNSMLRKLGQWTQEFYSPLKGDKGSKLVTQYDEASAQITVYFESLLHPQLTIQYDRKTEEKT